VLAPQQLTLPPGKAAPDLTTSGLPELTVTGAATGTLIHVSGLGFRYGFDAASGLLTSIHLNGTEILAGPLRPDFWRAPNDNDRGSDMMRRLGVWRDAHRSLTVAIGQPPLSVNALHHAAGDLDQAGHHHELPARSETYLNLDWKQMGLGGDNSWGALPLPQYRLKAEPMRCRFVLRPLATGESPMKLSKLSLP
jgi:hypothetical protein